MLQISHNLQYTKDFSVSVLIEEGKWTLPVQFNEDYRGDWWEILEVIISYQEEYTIVWQGSVNDDITIKDSYEFCKDKSIQIKWFRRLCKLIYHQKSVFLCGRSSTIEFLLLQIYFVGT